MNIEKITKDPRIQLRAIMEVYELSAEDVAYLVKSSKNTVNMWRAKNDRTIPAGSLELLKMKLKESQA